MDELKATTQFSIYSQKAINLNNLWLQISHEHVNNYDS